MADEKDLTKGAATPPATEVVPPTTEEVLTKALATLASLAETTMVKGVADEGKDLEKSFGEGDDTLEKSMEVSDFLNSIVTNIGDEMTNMRKSVSELGKANVTVSAELVKSLTGFGEVIKSLASKIEILEKSVPAGPKSALQKGDARFTGEEQKTKLTKSMVAGKLADMMMKGENGVTQVDVLSFESTGKFRNPAHAELFISKEAKA
jgi:hypothetical protein